VVCFTHLTLGEVKFQEMKLGMTQVNDGIVTCYNDKGFGFNHNTSSKKKKH
jgi:hypothetical protein